MYNKDSAHRFGHTLTSAKKYLAAIAPDLSLTKKDGEFRVRFKADKTGAADYFTNDLQDAIDTALAMIKERDLPVGSHAYWRVKLNDALTSHGLEIVPLDRNVLADIAAECLTNTESAGMTDGIVTLYVNLEAAEQSGEIIVKGF